MQLGSKETENERFAHYLTKTYRKTASLIANSVKAVSIKLYYSIYTYLQIRVSIIKWGPNNDFLFILIELYF